MDIRNLYESSQVDPIAATDFVQRVVERRVAHYCKSDLDFFFDTKSDELRAS
jgi:hypothetical protein